MKKLVSIALINVGFVFFMHCNAQCSICTKTAQQLGEQPAKGLNGGILYLAFAPFAIAGFVGYRWWRNNHEE